VHVADDPLKSVVRGTGLALKHYDRYPFVMRDDMRNVFLFIRRYFNFLFFVVLQIIALYLLFHYNEFHQAAFMRVANEMTGRISTRYSNVESYFTLKRQTNSLHRKMKISETS